MQTQPPTGTTAVPPQEKRIAVTFEIVERQQLEHIPLKSAGMAGEPVSFFRNPDLPKHGVPFSPLND